MFYHKEKDIRTFVHGDDYVSIGKLNSLKWVKEHLESKFQIKTQMLGPNQDQVKEVKILNRIVAWDQQKGITYEADPRHVEIMIDQLGLKDAKTVATPGTREEGRTQEEHNEPFNEEYTTHRNNRECPRGAKR